MHVHKLMFIDLLDLQNAKIKYKTILKRLKL